MAHVVLRGGGMRTTLLLRRFHLRPVATSFPSRLMIILYWHCWAMPMCGASMGMPSMEVNLRKTYVSLASMMGSGGEVGDDDDDDVSFCCSCCI